MTDCLDMAKANTGPDMNASLQVVKTEAAAVAGNKSVFIFTDSNVNAKPVIDQMITVFLIKLFNSFLLRMEFMFYAL